MLGWLQPPQDDPIEVQAQIDALESVIKLTGAMSIRDREKLEDLYYRRNKLKASAAK